MGILLWFIDGVKYYSHTQSLHTTGLLRYNGKSKKGKKNISKVMPKTTPPLSGVVFEIFFWPF
jgi:hypothetical protein